MPKKVTVSLKGIVKEIDEATKKLSGAKNKAISGLDKKKLAVKINNLKKIRAAVKANCATTSQSKPLPLPYGIVVNTK